MNTATQQLQALTNAVEKAQRAARLNVATQREVADLWLAVEYELHSAHCVIDTARAEAA